MSNEKRASLDPVAPQGKQGRPTLLTAEVQDRLVKSIQLGSTYSAASGYAGVAYDTVRSWLVAAQKLAVEYAAETTTATRRKRIEEDRYYRLLRALQDAVGQGAVRWLENIDKASDNDWRAGAWMLERRYPSIYGRQVHEVQAAPALRKEAERLALELGVDVDILMGEASRLAGEDIDAATGPESFPQ